MVTIEGKLLGSRHLELAEPVPPGEDSIQVRLVDTLASEFIAVGLLTGNPAFEFLKHEPDLYE